MNTNLLLPFLTGMIVLAATPGPGVFGSVAKAMADGFKMSLIFIGGLVLGDIIFLIMALVGLSAIAKIFGDFFLVLRIAGGLYLIYLAFRMYQSPSVNKINLKQGKNKRQTFVSGFLLTLGNPKPILFYASILPTIINFKDVNIYEVFLMIFLIVTVSFSVLGTYSYIASMSHKFMLNKNNQKIMNRAAGIILMLVGIYIILE